MVLLAACSATTIVYNRLDFLLPWYLERYVDLDREQANRLDAQLEPLLDWHRREELPKYLIFLDELLDALDGPLTASFIEERTLVAEDAWYRIRDRALEELLILGDDLNQEQIDEFIESLEKRQRKYEAKYLKRSDEQASEDAYDDLLDLFEDYLGRLNGSQRERVKEAAENLIRSDHVWLGERAAWVEAMDEELQRAPGWQDRIRRMIIDWESDMDPEALALYERNTLTVQQAMADVVNQRTDKQDRRLRRKVQDLRDDVQVLIRQTPDKT